MGIEKRPVCRLFSFYKLACIELRADRYFCEGSLGYRPPLAIAPRD